MKLVALLPLLCMLDADALARARVCKTAPVTTIVPLPSKATAIAVAHKQACAVLDTGRVWCWGNTADQQLVSTRADAIEPQDIGLDKVVEISLDDLASCARYTDGTVTCWGHKYGWNQALPQSKAARPPAKLVVERVSAGQDHTCVIEQGGHVSCYGELSSWGGFPAARPRVPGISNASDLDSGRMTDCAVTNGRVMCWGYPIESSCGAQCEKDRQRPVARALPGVDDALGVSVGLGRVCALRKNGEIQCWRSNAGGAGVLTTTVAGMNDAKQLSLGEQHGCAVRKTGEVACWGEGSRGALGDGHKDSRDIAKAVIGIKDAVTVGAGLGFSCALLGDGLVACWGINDHRQLGIQTLNASTKPVEVCGLDRVAAIASRESGTCAARANGDVLCWGAADGKSSVDHSAVPVLVPGVKAVELAAHGDQTCGRTKTGSVTCWGIGKAKLPGEPVRQIALGRFGLCAIANDRRVICNGEHVTYVDKADKVAVGDDFACALTDKAVACWGEGSRIDMPEQCSCPADERMHCTCAPGVPGKQPRVHNIVAKDIVVRRGEVCVRTKTNARCARPTHSLEHAQPSTLDPWESIANGVTQIKALSAGRAHTCVLHGNASVSCWGNNTYGQLGAGSLGLVHTPKTN